MQNKISIKKIKEDAEALFQSGGYFCSEAIVASCRNNFELDMPVEMVAMAAGFPVGIGRSKCLCGAVSGGVMVLGYFFGRKAPSNPNAPEVAKTFAVSKELHDYFKEAHGALCCRILTKGMDMASGEHKQQCVSFTGEVAGKVAEIVVRELGLTNIDAV
ncbi:MAG: C-GCAxxG-C-C family (seleno)protein [Clostridia bacterium]